MADHERETEEIIEQEASMLLADDADLTVATVPLTPAELEEIDEIAKELGVTRQALLRRMTSEFLKNHK